MRHAPTALLLAGTLTLALSAEAVAATSARRSTSYLCADQQKIVASYPDRSTAVVIYQGHVQTLTAAPSADGVRYVGAGLQWWTKGMTQGSLAPLKPGEKIASAPGVDCTASR